jgi:hypothetical protein
MVAALVLVLGGAAWAAPLAERTYSESSAPQSAPVVSERSYSDGPAVAAPEPADAASSAAPDAVAAPAAPAVPADDGLGAFVIVLIAGGGVLVLCALAYTARRVAHGHAAH